MYAGSLSRPVPQYAQSCSTQPPPLQHQSQETMSIYNNTQQLQMETQRQQFIEMLRMYANQNVHEARWCLLKLEHEKEVRELKSEIEMLKKKLGEFDEKSKMAIQETKLKLWCRRCFREATIYCCSNTNYCNISCKTADSIRHSFECLHIKRRLVDSEAEVIAKKSRTDTTNENLGRSNENK